MVVMSRRMWCRSRIFVSAGAAWLAIGSPGTAWAGLSASTHPPVAAEAPPATEAAAGPVAASVERHDEPADRLRRLSAAFGEAPDANGSVAATSPAEDDVAPGYAAVAHASDVTPTGVVIPAHPAAWAGGATLLLAAAVGARVRRWLA
ncbi:MAG TPA: hypothetical protein VF796_14535 [Humisphaera sp.]